MLKNKIVFTVVLALVFGLSALIVSAADFPKATAQVIDDGYYVVVDWGKDVLGNEIKSLTDPLGNFPEINSFTVNADGSVTVAYTVDVDSFTFIAINNIEIDTIAPTVTGVTDGATYTSAVTSITFSDGIALLEGPSESVPTSPFDVSTNGAWTLTVTDLAGNKTIIHFTVAIPPSVTPTPTPVVNTGGGSGYLPGYGPNIIGGIITPGQVLGAVTFRFTKVLRLGMTGNDVKELQELLRAEGFFTYKTSTGYFGNITKTALKAYQKAHKLIPYGVLNKATIAFINS